MIIHVRSEDMAMRNNAAGVASLGCEYMSDLEREGVSEWVGYMRYSRI